MDQGPSSWDNVGGEASTVSSGTYPPFAAQAFSILPPTPRHALSARPASPAHTAPERSQKAPHLTHSTGLSRPSPVAGRH